MIGGNAKDDESGARHPANKTPLFVVDVEALVKSKAVSPSTSTTTLKVLAVASTQRTVRCENVTAVPLELNIVANVLAVSAPEFTAIAPSVDDVAMFKVVYPAVD
jgi:hypothetical protein